MNAQAANMLHIKDEMWNLKQIGALATNYIDGKCHI